MHTILQRAIVPLVLALVGAALVVPTTLASIGDTPWAGGGTGTTSVVSDGTSAPAEFTYQYEVDCCASGLWVFSTVANSTRTVELDWKYSGYHAYYQVRVRLDAFVFDGVTETIVPLVNDGPVNCCTPPSGGFSYSGNVSLSVQAGDTYGFKMSGSNLDSDGRLLGQLTVDEPTTQCVVPPSGMVGWWPGDDNANDIVGGNNGTLQNDATFAAGKVDQAFSFDGVDDFVQIPNAALNNMPAGTIDMWIFPTANGGGAAWEYGRTWFAKQNNGINSYAVFAFKSPTDSQARFHLINQAQDVVGTTPLTLNAWHHVAATWDGSFIRVYVNGVKEGEVASTLGLPSDLGSVTSIGAWTGDGHSFFKGLIDEVEIFNHALTTEEIQAIFLAGSAGKCKNQPPDCSGATASPSMIWPPNHKMVSIGIAGVTDPDGDAVTINATGVQQDEAVRETGVGSGNTAPDATLSPLAVRAERNGNPKSPGNGRVYHIDFTADDGNGGMCTGTVTVCVPHDQGKGNTCVDGGPLYNSLAP